MSKIVVETFSDFDTIIMNHETSNVDSNCGDKSSKESSPIGSSSSSSRESSKRSTKDSTPAAGMETDSAQNQVFVNFYLLTNWFKFQSPSIKVTIFFNAVSLKITPIHHLKQTYFRTFWTSLLSFLTCIAQIFFVKPNLRQTKKLNFIYLPRISSISCPEIRSWKWRRVSYIFTKKIKPRVWKREWFEAKWFVSFSYRTLFQIILSCHRTDYVSAKDFYPLNSPFWVDLNTLKWSNFLGVARALSNQLEALN